MRIGIYTRTNTLFLAVAALVAEAGYTAVERNADAFGPGDFESFDGVAVQKNSPKAADIRDAFTRRDVPTFPLPRDAADLHHGARAFVHFLGLPPLDDPNGEVSPPPPAANVALVAPPVLDAVPAVEPPATEQPDVVEAPEVAEAPTRSRRRSRAQAAVPPATPPAE